VLRIQDLPDITVIDDGSTVVLQVGTVPELRCH
jgi:hypothetical protein